jgi:flavin reductase (DIM6/NTAB) family NADH-FMN oxidoreductase RutF
LSNGVKKDTLNNIEATGKWVFNVLSTNYLSKANECSASLPSNINEADVNGLELIWDCQSFDSGCDDVHTSSGSPVPPRLAAAKISMECHLIDKNEIYNDDGKHTTTIVMGRVRRFHIANEVYKDRGSSAAGAASTAASAVPELPVVDLEALQAVGRAGDITYWPVGTGTREVDIDDANDGDGNSNSNKRRRKETVLAMTRPQANYVGNATKTTSTMTTSSK